MRGGGGGGRGTHEKARKRYKGRGGGIERAKKGGGDYVILDTHLMTYCRVTSQFLVCDSSAAFSICDARD